MIFEISVAFAVGFAAGLFCMAGLVKWADSKLLPPVCENCGALMPREGKE